MHSFRKKRSADLNFLVGVYFKDQNVLFDTDKEVSKYEKMHVFAESALIYQFFDF